MNAKQAAKHIRIETERYEWAHAKAPRGRGWWLFFPTEECRWEDRISTGIGTYSGAKKRAQQIAAERGIPVLYLGT